MDNIAIVGVGGCGCSVLHCIAEQVGADQDLIAVNTDLRSLEACRASMKLQIGAARTRGLGTGGDISIGKQVAQADIEKFRNVLSGKELVVLILGLGGGTGTGAAPILVEAARERGATVLCLATFPFVFEGDQRRIQANLGIADLQECADALVVVRNDRLCQFIGEARIKEAFAKANEVFSTGVSAIWKMLTLPGYIDLDMSDLRHAIRGSGGVSTFGYGDASGETRAEEAARMLLTNPMLEQGNVVTHARSLLVSILAGPDLKLTEIGKVMDAIHEKAPRDCRIAMGTVVDEAWTGRLTVTAIASEQGKDEVMTETGAAPVVEQFALPGMVADLAETVEVSTTDARARRKRRATDLQAKLTFESTGKDRFKDTEPTILDGEDMDIPTFIRRRIKIDR